MNISDLKSSLAWFSDNIDDISAVTYAMLKNNDELYKIDIEGDSQNNMRDLFMRAIEERILKQDCISVLQYSSADERKNALYEYDLDDTPEDLLCFDQAIGNNNIPLLNLNDESIADIKALVIRIGTQEKQILLYKMIAPINIYKSQKNFFLIKDNTRMKQINDEFLRISDNFQMMHIDGKLVIVDLNAIEKRFGFHAVIKKEAVLGLNQIVQMAVLEDPNVYLALIDDVRIAKRLVKIADKSPVIQANIGAERIIAFCKTYPRLKGKFKFNDTEDKIILKTKIAKELFLKLLMDDFLTSDLTKYHYESLAKDIVEVESGAPE